MNKNFRNFYFIFIIVCLVLTGWTFQSNVKYPLMNYVM